MAQYIDILLLHFCRATSPAVSHRTISAVPTLDNVLTHPPAVRIR